MLILKIIVTRHNAYFPWIECLNKFGKYFRIKFILKKKKKGLLWKEFSLILKMEHPCFFGQLTTFFV